MSETYTFGASQRESHDARPFYNRALYAGLAGAEAPARPLPPLDGWVDQIYCQSSTAMTQVPDDSVGLAFTSPPYNVGKEYDEDLSLADYLDLLTTVGREVYRTLRPGGRYGINVANLGRKPYIALNAHLYHLHLALGFLPLGEIIWQKAKGAGGNCAWGSWQSAKAPVLRDIHEYILIFGKEGSKRPDRGESTIARDEFMAATLSIWEIPPASAKRIGHPAPFPVALPARAIQLYTYADDVVLDPFCGAGTTCVAAAQAGRHYVGYDINADYVALAQTRLATA